MGANGEPVILAPVNFDRVGIVRLEEEAPRVDDQPTLGALEQDPARPPGDGPSRSVMPDEGDSQVLGAERRLHGKASGKGPMELFIG